MKFRDLFVPKYLHSDPDVRIKFVNKLDDKNLIKQMSEKDENQGVRAAALDRLQSLQKRTTVSV